MKLTADTEHLEQSIDEWARLAAAKYLVEQGVQPMDEAARIVIGDKLDSELTFAAMIQLIGWDEGGIASAREDVEQIVVEEVSERARRLLA